MYCTVRWTALETDSRDSRLETLPRLALNAFWEPRMCYHRGNAA